jgi:CheY-like chemotaxis protein
MSHKSNGGLLHGLEIVVADGNPYIRRLIRGMLMTLGARSVIETDQGIATLEVICARNPAVVLLDADLPLYSGLEVVRAVRKPNVFPCPHVPIIMMSNGASQSEVQKAMRAGVHEFLLKPISAKALQDRLTAILTIPRAMTRTGDYYGPEPRPQINSPQVKAPQPSRA